MWTLTLSPLLVIGRPTTFDRLSAEDQQRVLDRVNDSSSYLARQLPLTIKLLSCFAYFRDGDVHDRVGEADP